MAITNRDRAQSRGTRKETASVGQISLFAYVRYFSPTPLSGIMSKTHPLSMNSGSAAVEMCHSEKGREVSVYGTSDPVSVDPSGLELYTDKKTPGYETERHRRVIPGGLSI